MRRAATRRTYSTSERAVARRAERVSKDIATSVVGSGTRSGSATRARAKGKVSARTVCMAKLWQGYTRRQGVRQRKGRRWQGRHAEGLFWVCGSTEHVVEDCPRNTNVQQVEEDVPEILFIGNVQNKEALEGWKKMPMKVSLGDFVKDTPRVPIQKTHTGRTGVTKNRFKVLDVDEEDEEEVVNVRQVANSERSASMVCDFEDGKAKNRVQFVNSVIKEEDWASLGDGDIIVDSAADESCWPAGLS